jgi:hypothetical protein
VEHRYVITTKSIDSLDEVQIHLSSFQAAPLAVVSYNLLVFIEIGPEAVQIIERNTAVLYG